MSHPAPTPAPLYLPRIDTMRRPRLVEILANERIDIGGRGDRKGDGSSNDLISGAVYLHDQHEFEALSDTFDRERLLTWWQTGKDSSHEILLQRRQSAQQQRCFVGNNQLSCYPEEGSQVVQDTWGKFIWNTNYPDFTNNGGFVDIYLFHQDNDQIATSWFNVPNSQSRVSFRPGDLWWQGRPAADNFSGQNISWPFYFVITYAGRGLGGTTRRLSTWYAIQTALPVKVALSRSSASLASIASQASLSAATLTGQAASSLSASRAAASASFAAALTSSLVANLTAQGFTGTQTLQATATTTLSNGIIVLATATGRADGHLPDLGESASLPKFAIILIVIFGFVALVGATVGLYSLLAAARRRRLYGAQASSRSANDSDTPMMKDGEAAFSEDHHTLFLDGEGPVRVSSRNGSNLLITSKDASRMAHAYRAALREPSTTPHNDLTRDSDEVDSQRNRTTPQGAYENPAEALLKEELRADGQDLKQVGERHWAEIHD